MASGEGRSSDRGGRAPMARVAALLGALVGLTASCSVAGAALEPGTPVDVAPGVPSHGRAWELVTPEDVNNGLLYLVQGVAVDGDRVLYQAFGKLADAPDSEFVFSTNLASRGVDGWTNTPVIAPSQLRFSSLLTLDSGIEGSIWRGSFPSGEGALFRGPLNGDYTLQAEATPAFLDSADFIGSSADLQHLVFASEDHVLAPDADRTSGKSIYELVGSTMRLVDVGDDGALLSDCGSSGVSPNGVSADGQRIFFTTHPSCGANARVYLRQNGTATTEVSASRCDLPDCGPEADVSFLGATPSGSSAFLVTEQRLTDEDSNSLADFYRYDVSSGELTLLFRGPDGAELTPFSYPILKSSTDGSRVYVTGSEHTPQGNVGEGLYLVDGSGLHLVPGVTTYRFFQVSSDGRYVVFSSAGRLVGGDTDESEDVYRYDAVDHTVALVSAGTDGGNGPFGVRLEPAEENVEFSFRSSPYRAMSDDGSRIFFDTAERLLPQDRNDVEDVYEWENGNLGLISSGAGTRSSRFVNANPAGTTAFFLTNDTLLPRDRDGGDLDLYAARVGGGFPEPPPESGCEGDSCPVPPRGRIARAAARSAGPAGGGIRLGRIGAAERRQIVATGWITLLLEVPTGGRLSAEAQARIGQGSRTVAAKSVEIAQAGPARLRMRLSEKARQVLADGRDLHLRLLLRLSRFDRRLGIELKGGRR
jgi:hypothetical protein